MFFFFGGRQARERASRKRERREADSSDEESETVFALILWGHFPPRLSSALVLHHARMTALQSSPSSEGKGDKEKERAQGGAREENRKQRKASMSPRRRHSFFLFDHDPERPLSLFSCLSLFLDSPTPLPPRFLRSHCSSSSSSSSSFSNYSFSPPFLLRSKSARRP